MVHMARTLGDIAPKDIDRLPRGGPDASCLDRLLEPGRFGYLDRGTDGPGLAERKRNVLRTLQWVGAGAERFAAIVLDAVAEVADPLILELDAGDGALSRLLLDWHPGARVTVTDLDDATVEALAAGELGRHPRAEVRAMDATAIDAADGEFDLAVMALSFHLLPPPAAAQALAEGTRVADKLVIIDPPRPPAPVAALQVAALSPLTPVLGFVRDGLAAGLRSYSRSALRALAAHADPTITLRVRHLPPLGPQVVIATRRPADGSAGAASRRPES
jgi:hypothetical protein